MIPFISIVSKTAVGIPVLAVLNEPAEWVARKIFKQERVGK